MKQTKIQEIFQKNKNLANTIARLNKQKTNRITSLNPDTIRRAVKGKNARFDTKWEIWMTLVELGLIDMDKVKVKDLFGE